MEKKLLEAFNNQINAEFNSAYLYYAMSTYFDEIIMLGFVNFMKQQAIEKLSVAQKMYDYLILRDEKLVFEKIQEPNSDWINISDIFTIALNHEEYMLQKTNDLYNLAEELNDIGTIEFISKLISKKEGMLSQFRKIVFRIQNSDIIPIEVQGLDKEIKNMILN